MKYAEVILPLPLAQTYTYAIPEGMASQVLRNGRGRHRMGSAEIAQ